MKIYNKCFLRNKEIKPLLLSYNKFNFNLYIPKKKLETINHSKYGLVIPVYIANTNHSFYNKPIDEFYNSKIKKNFIFGSSVFTYSLVNYFTGFSLFIHKYLYKLLFPKDFESNNLNLALITQPEIFFFIPVILLYYFIRQYELIYKEKKNKIIALYLDINGKDLIIEKIEGTIYIDTGDIFYNNIDSKWHQNIRKEKYYDNNSNSLNIRLMYGRNKKLIINGPTLFLDFEILQYIINKYNIDTSQTTYSRDTIKKLNKKNSKISNSFQDRRNMFKYLNENYFFERINKTKILNFRSYYREYLRKNHNNKMI